MAPVYSRFAAFYAIFGESGAVVRFILFRRKGAVAGILLALQTKSFPPALAIHCYNRTLTHWLGYAESHHYLSKTLKAIGRNDDSKEVRIERGLIEDSFADPIASGGQRMGLLRFARDRKRG